MLRLQAQYLEDIHLLFSRMCLLWIKMHVKKSKQTIGSDNEHNWNSEGGVMEGCSV